MHLEARPLVRRVVGRPAKGHHGVEHARRDVPRWAPPLPA
jgi:hypothetical protein